MIKYFLFCVYRKAFGHLSETLFNLVYDRRIEHSRRHYVLWHICAIDHIIVNTAPAIALHSNSLTRLVYHLLLRETVKHRHTVRRLAAFVGGVLAVIPLICQELSTTHLIYEAWLNTGAN